MTLQRRGLTRALALLALAARGSASNTTESVPWGEPPEGVRNPYNVAEYFARAPNATGSWPIKGVDLTRAWAGKDGLIDEGWELFTSYWAGLDGHENSTYNPSRTWLRVPPDTLSGDAVDSNWAVCIYNVDGVRWSEEDAQKMWDEDDDGDCAGLVPQECIDDMIKIAESSDRMCDLRYPTPDSCDGILDDGEGIHRVLSANKRDGADTASNIVALNENGTSVVTHWTNFPGTSWVDEDEETAAGLTYDYGITQVVPHIISYKYFGEGSNHSHSFFKCTRPNRVAEGSRQPDTAGDSLRDAAGMLEAPLTAVIVGTLAILLIGAA